MFDGDKLFAISVVYSSTDYIKRSALWQVLSYVQANFSMPWSCIGDFRTIIGAHEYRGPYSPQQAMLSYGSMEERVDIILKKKRLHKVICDQILVGCML